MTHIDDINALHAASWAADREELKALRARPEAAVAVLSREQRSAMCDCYLCDVGEAIQILDPSVDLTKVQKRRDEAHMKDIDKGEEAAALYAQVETMREALDEDVKECAAWCDVDRGCSACHRFATCKKRLALQSSPSTRVLVEKEELERLRKVERALIDLPQGLFAGANRYDTGNSHKLHLWVNGISYDIEVPK